MSFSQRLLNRTLELIRFYNSDDSSLLSEAFSLPKKVGIGKFYIVEKSGKYYHLSPPSHPFSAVLDVFCELFHPKISTREIENYLRDTNSERSFPEDWIEKDFFLELTREVVNMNKSVLNPDVFLCSCLRLRADEILYKLKGEIGEKAIKSLGVGSKCGSCTRRKGPLDSISGLIKVFSWNKGKLSYPEEYSLLDYLNKIESYFLKKDVEIKILDFDNDVIYIESQSKKTSIKSVKDKFLCEFDEKWNIFFKGELI